jgi:hypothetical protein
MRQWISLVLVLVALSAMADSPLSQGVPDTAQGWIISEPEEIVAYVLFDPTAVADRLPEFLSFITVGELSKSGVGWAVDHLGDEPGHGDWGISFLEIVRTGTFEIDGRSPEWPDEGAASLWLARVKPSAPSVELGPGTPLLVLEFWMPDEDYVAYMREAGYYAAYGDAKLVCAPDGRWSGSVYANGLEARAECRPCGPVRGGPHSHVHQVLAPPASFASGSVIALDLSGHRIRDCQENSSWEIAGSHPLAECVVLGPSTFQFGYELHGAVVDLEDCAAIGRVKPN